MQHAAIVAFAVALATGLAALLVTRRMRPDVAARLISALLLLSFAGAFWALCLIAIGCCIRSLLLLLSKQLEPTHSALGSKSVSVLFL